MKRVSIVLALILMLSTVAFVPYTLRPHDELFRPKRTPTPLATATPAPVLLTAPTLISPPNGATVPGGDVTLVWSAVPGAACYHVQAGLNVYLDEQSNIIDYGCWTDTSYTFNASPGFIQYFPHLYWRVRARTTTDIYGTYGPWSEVWYFNLVNP